MADCLDGLNDRAFHWILCKCLFERFIFEPNTHNVHRSAKQFDHLIDGFITQQASRSLF